MSEEITIYNVRGEIQGNKYSRLLESALEHSGYFTLVWREQLSLKPEDCSVYSSFKDLQVLKRRSDRWPGTILVDHYATVITYKISPQALPELAKPGSVYSWLDPEYPEDIAFYDTSGWCQFASIAHERDAWFYDTAWAKSMAGIITLSKAKSRETRARCMPNQLFAGSL